MTGALVVHGKGNRHRLAYVTNSGKAALEDWLPLRGSTAGPLFYAMSKTGLFKHHDQS